MARRKEAGWAECWRARKDGPEEAGVLTSGTFAATTSAAAAAAVVGRQIPAPDVGDPLCDRRLALGRLADERVPEEIARVRPGVGIPC